MASCTNIKLLKSNIESFIDYYESALKDGSLSQDEVASTEAALSRLKSNQKAIDADDREFLETSGYINQRNKEKGKIFDSTFKGIVGEEFTFRYGRDGNTTKARLLGAVPVEGGIAVSMSTRNGVEQYVFPMTSTGASLPIKGTDNYIYISDMDKILDQYTIELDNVDSIDTILGSTDSKLRLQAKYKQGEYIHGNKDSMKDMLEHLHMLGGSKATIEDLEHYKSIIDMTSEEFFDGLELYMKTGEKSSEGITRGTSRIDIAINSGARVIGNQQSEASIYIEEVLHSMTSSAIESKTPEANRLKRQLAHTIELARKTVKVEDFLPEESIDPKAEMEFAKRLYDYIFSGKNGDHEFLAKGLAVPEVKKVFENIDFKGPKKTKLVDRLNDLLGMVIDVLRGNITIRNKPDNVHESLVSLSIQLGEINSKASKRRDRAIEGTVGFAMELVNNMDDKVRVKLEDIRNWLITRSDTKLEKMPDDYYGKVKWTVDVITKAFTSPVYRKVIGAAATAYGIKPDSTLREIIGGMFATDSAQKVAEFLALQSGKVDKWRNTQINLVRGASMEGFSSRDAVSEEQEKALTPVLMDTDLAALFGKDSVTVDRGTRKVTYDNKTIRNLLTNPEALNKRISDVKKVLKDYDGAHYEWHKNQAVALGIYLATHKGTPELNLNAHNIARGIHSSHKKKADKNVVKAIDELATLQALVMTSKEQKQTVADLMKTEWKGVAHLADMIEGFKQNSKESVFEGNQTNMIKGYSKELFDDTIIMEVAPVADEELMKSQGYKKVSNLNNRAGDIRNKQMAVYVTYSASRPDRVRGAARLNQIRAKGQSIRNLAFTEDPDNMPQLLAERGRRDIINIQKEALKRAKEMEKPGFKMNESIYGVLPVLSNSGTVTDYRYMMDKETKTRILGQDTRVSEVLARSYGSLNDKVNTKEHNKRVLESLVKDMDDNWHYGNVGNDGLTHYTEIGPDADTAEGKELYYMLPNEFQEHIKRRQDKTLAVRTDLKNLYFGYSNMSIANFAGMQNINPPMVTQVIKNAEMWWMEAVKVVKGNILLKMPSVLIGNIVANFISAALKGYNPAKVASLYSESYKDINMYNSYKKEVQNLENSIRNNNVALNKELLPSETKKRLGLENKRNQQKIESLNRRIERDLGHIDEIVKLGLDQNLDDSSEIDSNRISRFFENQMSKTPELVRDGVDILFLTKNTKFYKIANEFLEVSDLIARDVQNRIEKENIQKQVNGKAKLPNWYLDTREKGYKPTGKALKGVEREKFLEMAKAQREYDLVEDFINYAKPSGRFEEYLNKIGLLMFTKYTKRIQRIILKNSSNHPLKTTLGLLAMGFIGGYPSIHESSFMVKDYYGDSLGAGNIFPIYAPTETLMNFVTPALLKDSTYEL